LLNVSEIRTTSDTNSSTSANRNLWEVIVPSCSHPETGAGERHEIDNDQ
jgi:hypothetical protein